MRCVMCHCAQVQNKNLALHSPELSRQDAQSVLQLVSVLCQAVSDTPEQRQPDHHSRKRHHQASVRNRRTFQIAGQSRRLVHGGGARVAVIRPELRPPQNHRHGRLRLRPVQDRHRAVSSSHTVGPMRAARLFALRLQHDGAAAARRARAAARAVRLARRHRQGPRQRQGGAARPGRARARHGGRRGHPARCCRPCRDSGRCALLGAPRDRLRREARPASSTAARSLPLHANGMRFTRLRRRRRRARRAHATTRSAAASSSATRSRPTAAGRR